MPLTLQTRLLRVIEEYEIVPLGGDTPVPVDLHVISASHRDIRQMVQEGEFREDLYYRLNGTTLHLPLLKDRADRAELIEVLLHEENPTGDPVRIQPDALHALLNYHWPGNIRQLRNVLRTAAALCLDNVIRLPNLPQELLDCAGEEPRTQRGDIAAGRRTRRRGTRRYRQLLPHAARYGGACDACCASSSATAGTSRTRPMRSASAATRCIARYASIRFRSPNSAAQSQSVLDHSLVPGASRDFVVCARSRFLRNRRIFHDFREADSRTRL